MRLLTLFIMFLTPQLLQARLLYGQLAAKDLIAFAQLTSPMPSDPLNVAVSRYQVAMHHKYIARKLMAFGRREGNKKNLMISIPYRHGKSELSVRKFVPWLAGNFPYESGIVITHTDTLAHELGRDCRDVFNSGGYRTAFPRPECQLRNDSQAMDRLQTVAGGVWMFTGRGGMGGGYGARWILFDDFFKNAEEARSEAVRNHAWHCYVSDCSSRLNEETGGICMIGTRKAEDDPQGRILDPTNLNFDATERDKWEVVRLPALAEENDPLGRKVGEALWPERFSQQYWVERRDSSSELVREDFQVQGQCNPRPTEGTWFKKPWLKTYKLADLPKHLRIYVASDHAYRTKEKNDSTCLLVVGVDPTGTIYVLPDTWWEKAETTVIVDAMFAIAKKHKVAAWWAARDAISGSLAPFITRRMIDESIFFPLDDSIAEKTDLVARSSSIRGMMALGLVLWPAEWPKTAAAHNQLLSFPGSHDDMVAALAMLGMGIDKMVTADGGKKKDIPQKGTFAWHSFGQNQNQKAKGWV